MNPKEKNWHNFCEYHNGDWYGTWTKYNSEKEVIDSFQCIRSFKVNSDRSEIKHQNHYTYTDGRKETKTFGPYKNTNTMGVLYLDNSFYFGSPKVDFSKTFALETGFRYRDRRGSLATIYNPDLTLQRITVISEHLDSNITLDPRPLPAEICESWQGIEKEMKPDLTVSEPKKIEWTPLKDADLDYSIFNLNDGLSVTCPTKIELGKDFIIAVNWLFDCDVLYRGIANYKSNNLSNFNLEFFSSQ